MMYIKRAIRKALDRGGVWLVTDTQGSPVATATVDDYADPEFWTPDDDPGSALYVHRMAVTRAHAGHELGSAILDWTGRRAVFAGKKWLRLWSLRRSEVDPQGGLIGRAADLPHDELERCPHGRQVIGEVLHAGIVTPADEVNRGTDRLVVIQIDDHAPRLVAGDRACHMATRDEISHRAQAALAHDPGVWHTASGRPIMDLLTCPGQRDKQLAIVDTGKP